MKLQRLIPLTCSVALASALTACGGGGEKGPQWAQTTVAELKAPPPLVISDIKTYALPCSDDVNSTYSEIDYVVTFKTSDGKSREQVQRHWYIGTGCSIGNLAVVFKVPADVVTNDSTFTEPDLNLTAIRQTKTNPGGTIVVSIQNPSVTVESLIEEGTNAPFYRVTLPPSNGATVPFEIDTDATQAAVTTRDLAAYSGNSLYWGASNALDSQGYPTHLLFNDPTQVFALTANTSLAAPVMPGAVIP